MKEKYIICNCNESNTGKSTSLNYLIDKIITHQLNNKNIVIRREESLYDGATNGYTDYFVMIEHTGVHVAIITQGDYPDSALNQYIEISISAEFEADIIICAANKRSQIEGNVKLKQYKKIYIKNDIASDPNKISICSANFAEKVKDEVKRLYNIDLF